MKRTIRKVLCLLLLLLLFPMQTRGAVESETTAQSEKLRLDNENRYEGMEKAYQDGYEPEVSGESVSVILPLMWNGKNEVDTITASLDQGDQNTAPFIFQNYQKTFKKTEEKINDTDQTREVFLIKVHPDRAGRPHAGRTGGHAGAVQYLQRPGHHRRGQGAGPCGCPHP